MLKNLGEHGKDKQRAIDQGILFHPEYGRFMLEATPYQPYDGETIEGYAEVEKNMSIRRTVAHNEMGDKMVHATTLTAFPTMGCDNFTYPKAVPEGPASQSLFLPDEVIDQRPSSTNTHGLLPSQSLTVPDRPCFMQLVSRRVTSVRARLVLVHAGGLETHATCT